ncbi:DUF6412 domain-containing protein [Streptacidiphilus neutrinimicus]|uniref:DUF6412 domain-containing protein n=1 Tax=Streptacidiphilus neutrinimicus TaxID=105420 RepID=UPI0006950272|nr:DUF6412 domain-containing protein [Streptacidiphilus neutrinimicus]
MLTLLPAQTLHLLLPAHGPLLAVAALATLALLVSSATHRAVRESVRLLAADAGAARRRGPLRAYAWHTDFMPQRDPDARGRRRPRAPAARLRAVTD